MRKLFLAAILAAPACIAMATSASAWTEIATRDAASITDGVSSMVLELDGKRFNNLESHRQATGECFDFAARAGGGVAPSAANGYYVMLRPLSRGTHTINFGAILPDMSQAVTYTLIVE